MSKRFIRLGVNIDHIATLRQVRKTFEPDPVAAAYLAELGGADQITLHLREDRRHIQDRDLRILRETVATSLNLEMAASIEMFKIAKEYKPDWITLVPEKREELTTEGGLKITEESAKSLEKNIKSLQKASIKVSLFVDPDYKALEWSYKIGADAVEIHTGSYANSARNKISQEIENMVMAVEYAHTLRLSVHAGHGLTYYNVKPIASLEYIEELNIGHSIIARALLVGMEKAVREMRILIDSCRVEGFLRRSGKSSK